MSNLLEKASIITTPTAYSDGVLHSVKPEQTLGSELVTNGDFATDSDWNKGTGWSISNNTAISDGSTVSGSIIAQTIQLVEGKTYQVILNVDSVDAGRVRFYSNFLGGGQADITSSGTFTYNLISSITGGRTVGIQARDDGTESVINSISVKEVTNADFTFTRNNIGTRLNVSGNIESVGVDLPRIDYLGGSGSWLLEPEATNTATDSNDFTTGDIFEGSGDPGVDNGILTSAQATSPDGTNNAWKLADNNDGNTGKVTLRYYNTFVPSNSYNTVSLFVKKQGNNDWFYYHIFDFGGTGKNTWFDIANGTLGNVASGHTASIDDYGNGWYRCSLTFQTTTSVEGAIQFRLATSNGATNILRDGTNGVYIYGIQAESHATRQYATSYIPTSGSTVTRGADSALDAGSSDLISSTEGVLYAEISALANDGIFRVLSLNDGSVGGDNRVRLQYTSVDNTLAAVVKSVDNTTRVSISVVLTDLTEFHKVAFKYKANDFSLWINGTEYVGTPINGGGVPIGLNKLSFDSGVGNPFYGNVKCVAVFQEALTDAELTCLTTI